MISSPPQERLPGISLCMIVRNEEAFLDDALRSVADTVDEICIVDTGSTDRTIDIARAHGARVEHVPWRDDFALARNAALDLATRAWILVLDADERVHPESLAALRAVRAERSELRGKWIMCRNLSDDYKGSGASTNALVRVFPNHPRIRYRNAIHEFVALDGLDSGLPADMTSIELIHHGYLSAIVRDRRKGERNLRLSRLAKEREPDEPFHHYNDGMASLLCGDTDGAIAALEVTRALTRGTPRGYRAHALCVLAGLYAERADRAAALTVISDGLAIAPNYSSLHFTHGKVLAADGQFYAARDAFGRAIAAGAHDHEQFVVDGEIAVWKAHSEIGATLMAEGRYADALRWFELASQARPFAQPLVINRAKCHEQLGDLAAAERLLASAFAGYADEPSAIEWVNFLLRHERTGAALAAIATALPNVGDGYRRVLLGTAAAVNVRAGHTDAARTALAQALDIGDRAESDAILRALAERIGVPELVPLLTPAVPARAPRLHIAYNSKQ